MVGETRDAERERLKNRITSQANEGLAAVAIPEDNDAECAEEPFREWLADLDAPDTDTREFAALLLENFAYSCHMDGKPVPSDIVPPLIDALRDPESSIRGRAAAALATVASDEARAALPQLIELLADNEEEDGARCKIAGAVAELGGRHEAVPILLRLLRDGSDEVREAAGIALERADLSGLDVEGELRACLSDKSPVVRTWVCWSLWQLTGQGKEFVPLLLAALRYEPARLDAARLLCWMKDQAQAALPQLLALRLDPNWGVRIQAVRATMLIPCGDEVALPVLEALRCDPDKIVRVYVATALKKRGRS